MNKMTKYEDIKLLKYAWIKYENKKLGLAPYEGMARVESFEDRVKFIPLISTNIRINIVPDENIEDFIEVYEYIPAFVERDLDRWCDNCAFYDFEKEFCNRREKPTSYCKYCLLHLYEGDYEYKNKEKCQKRWNEIIKVGERL